MKIFALHFISASIIFVLFNTHASGNSTGESPLRDSLRVTIVMERMECSIQDQYVLTINLENKGSVVIEVPDPFYEHDKQYWYHIEGPGNEGMTNHDYMTEGREYFRIRPMRQDFDDKQISLVPGERVSGDIPLSRAIGISGPGQYHVTVELEWRGQNIRSNTLSFVLHEEK